MSDVYLVEEGGEGKRLDSWLAEATGMTRSQAQRLAGTGRVLVNGVPAPKSALLEPGQRVTMIESASAPGPDDGVDFRIRYEDEDLVVVAKPAGVLVHPAPGTPRRTLVDALGERMALAPAGGARRPGIVHRLDRDTSGLLVVAKTDSAWSGLVRAMKARAIEREYQVLVAGVFELPTGRIEAPVGRSVRNPTRMSVTSGGREAVTEFRVLERHRLTNLVQARLHTGRTHQIRVHFSHLGHPVVGDRVYGRSGLELARRLEIVRPFLHAGRLGFVHPLTGQRVEVSEPLPDDLVAALVKARRA